MTRLLAAILWLLLLGGGWLLGVQSRAPAETSTAPPTAFDSALERRDPLARSFEISRFLQAVDAQTVDRVVEAVEAAGFWFDQQEHRLLMAAWVPIDPAAAAVWAFSRPGLLQDRAAEALVEALGYSDPEQARYVLLSLEDRDQADYLYGQMIRGWARSDRRDELAEYLAGQPPGYFRQKATAVLANEILRGGPDALIDWVDAIEADPGNAFKRTAFQSSANAMAQIDPERAARWLEDHLGRAYALRAPNVVARNWMEKDPAAALSWVVSLPEESTERDRTKQLFARWLRQDAKSAESWVRAAAPAAQVDPLLRVIVRRELRRDPALAMEWAHLLHDPLVRSRVQTSAGRSWYRSDREAFLAWLPDSGLEQQVRELILDTPALPEPPGADTREATPGERAP